MKKHIFIFAAGISILGSALFSSCKKDEEIKKKATINVVHAAPHLPGIRVYDREEPLEYAINFGGQTGYFDVEAGNTMMKFKMLKEDSTLYTLAANLPEGQHYTMFLTDSLHYIDSPHKVHSLLVSDDLSIPPNGKARVRFVHLCANGYTVDVRDTFRRKVVFPNVSSNDISSFTDLDAGVYNLSLCYPGIIQDSILFRLPTMVFNNQKIYTVYIKGFWGGGDRRTQLSADVITNQW